MAAAEEDRRLREEADAAVAERTRRADPDNRTLLVKNLAGVDKMSEVLKEFAAPLLERCQSNKDSQVTIQLAALAWNAALLPEPERTESLRANEVAPVLGTAGRDIMDYLIRRKLDRFPHLKRPIFHVEVAELSDELYVSVASGLEGDDPRTVQALKARGLLPEQGPPGQAG